MIKLLFVERILKNTFVFKDVPAKLKSQVANTLINQEGKKELVPIEYGGTLLSAD